jgi:hypothetical protein
LMWSDLSSPFRAEGVWGSFGSFGGGGGHPGTS